MMKILIVAILIFAGFYAFAQNKADVSLFLRKDSSTYLREIHSKSGNLFHELGHHGPAIENEWMGIRLYFDSKAAIDIYSKSTPGLELRETRWYPSPEQLLSNGQNLVMDVQYDGVPESNEITLPEEYMQG